MAENLVVIVSTCGEPTSLRRTLDSLAACRKPLIYLKTIVIERPPKKYAEQIVGEYKSVLNSTYIYNSTCSLSNALNEVIMNMRDELILFTNDNVRFDPEVLEAYAKAAEGKSKGEFYGGLLKIDYEKEPSEWLDHCWLSLSVAGWPKESIEKDAWRYFMSNNWAVFAQDIKEAGGFNQDLGAGSLFRADFGFETDLQLRLLKARIKQVFVSDAVIWNYVKKKQISLFLLLRQRYAEMVYMGLQIKFALDAFGYPRHTFKEYCYFFWKIIKDIVFAKRYALLEDLFNFQAYRGVMRGYHLQKKIKVEKFIPEPFIRDISEISIPKFPQKLPGTFWGITAFYNPSRYKSKLQNYRRFREANKKQGLKLLAVELIGENDKFELQKDDADIIIQLKTLSVMWQKERLLNIGLQHLPKDCDKIVYLDIDIIFYNDHWIEQTAALLESYMVVQPFAFGIILPKGVYSVDNPNEIIFAYDVNLDFDLKNEIEKRIFGIAYRNANFSKDTYYGNSLAFSGGAWAFRRSLLEKHGFFDRLIIGGADFLMALAFYNNKDNIFFSLFPEKLLCNFQVYLDEIYKEIKGSVYYTNGEIIHLWHGSQKQRFYGSRYGILKKTNFDPERDIKINKDGCWEWATNKPDLHRMVKEYFWRRNEDDSILQKLFWRRKSWHL